MIAKRSPINQAQAEISLKGPTIYCRHQSSRSLSVERGETHFRPLTSHIYATMSSKTSRVPFVRYKTSLYVSLLGLFVECLSGANNARLSWRLALDAKWGPALSSACTLNWPLRMTQDLLNVLQPVGAWNHTTGQIFLCILLPFI